MNLLPEKIFFLLENYPQEFKTYFYDQTKPVIDFFAEARPDQRIDEWLFSEANQKGLPPKTSKPLINHIQGLSSMHGFSFIRQYLLADKIEISDRWLRNLAQRIKNIGLLFSRRTKRINYTITFDLGRSVIEYFQTLIKITFEYFSESSCLYSDSSSQVNSEQTSGSQSNSFLATLLYQKTCNPSSILESMISPRKKEKVREEKEASNASTNQGNNTNVEEKEATTANNISTANSTPTRPKRKIKSINTVTPLGKYSLDEYRLYADWCKRSGQDIESVEAIARYCWKTGAQDKQVADYLHLSVGASVAPRTEKVDSEVNNSSSSPSPEKLAKWSRDVQQQQEQERLGKQGWGKLTDSQQTDLISLELSQYKEKHPDSWAILGKEGATRHVVGLITWNIGRLLSERKLEDLDMVGEQLWEELEDWQQGEMIEGRKDVGLKGFEWELVKEALRSSS